MARRRRFKKRRARRNPLSTTTTIVIGVVGVAAVGGIIYYLVQRSKLSVAADKALTGGVKGGAEGGLSRDQQADADAAKAAADAEAAKVAAEAAAKAAAKAATDAAAVALIKAASNAGTAAYVAKFNLGGSNNIGDIHAWAFQAAVAAVQAVGVPQSQAVGIVWGVARDFFTSRGYSQGQAEGYATEAQKNAGYGTHTSSLPNMLNAAQSFREMMS
jgi:hypothetical protein